MENVFFHVCLAKVRKLYHNLTGIRFHWVLISVNMALQSDQKFWHFIHQVCKLLLRYRRHGVVIPTLNTGCSSTSIDESDLSEMISFDQESVANYFLAVVVNDVDCAVAA